MKLFMPHFPPENKTTTQPKPKSEQTNEQQQESKGYTEKKHEKEENAKCSQHLH